MRNSRLNIASLLILLCTSSFSAEAQTPTCDVRENCGVGSISIGQVTTWPAVFETFCNTPPQDVVCHPGWPNAVNVTCHDCMPNGPNHTSAWEKAGTENCSIYDKTLVLTFSEPVADVEFMVYGARTVTDNRGYTVRMPAIYGNGRFDAFMWVKLPGPGITSITVSDPIERPIYYPNGALYALKGWDMWVDGFGGNLYYVPDRLYQECNCDRPTMARPNPQGIFSPDWSGNGIPDWGPARSSPACRSVDSESGSEQVTLAMQNLLYFLDAKTLV